MNFKIAFLILLICGCKSRGAKSNLRDADQPVDRDQSVESFLLPFAGNADENMKFTTATRYEGSHWQSGVARNSDYAYKIPPLTNACPNHQPVSIPFFQYNGRVTRLMRASSDAPFIWVIKSQEDSSIFLGVLSWGRTLEQFSDTDTGHYHKGDDLPRVKETEFMTYYRVSGTIMSPVITRLGWVPGRIPYDPKLLPNQSMMITSLQDVEDKVKGPYDSAALVTPETLKIQFKKSGQKNEVSFTVAFADGCGAGVPLEVDYVTSIKQTASYPCRFSKEFDQSINCK